MVLESNYPTEGGGGAEGQLRTLSRWLTEHGVGVHIIVPMREWDTHEDDAVDGVPVWRVPYPRIRKLGGLIMLWRMAVWLIRRRRDYQVIHAHIAHNMALVAALVGRLLGKTVIVKITGSLEIATGVLDPAVRRPDVLVRRRLLRAATWYQATSSEIRDRLVEAGVDASRIHVIPNAVDVRRFNIDRSAHQVRPLTAVYVGRLSEEKAPDVMIAAWMRAFAGDAPVRLLCVGEGAMRSPLQKAIDDHKRGEQIRLLGAQDDVRPWLAQADFAILPSHYEGLSNALLEAMAAGLPVLGTRVSGTVDFIEPGRDGWLVDPGDVEAMSAAMREAAETPDARRREMGQAARQKIIARARIDAVVEQLAALYDIDAQSLRTLPQGKLV